MGLFPVVYELFPYQEDSSKADYFSVPKLLPKSSHLEKNFRTNKFFEHFSRILWQLLNGQVKHNQTSLKRSPHLSSVWKINQAVFPKIPYNNSQLGSLLTIQLAKLVLENMLQIGVGLEICFCFRNFLQMINNIRPVSETTSQRSP